MTDDREIDVTSVSEFIAQPLNSVEDMYASNMDVEPSIAPDYDIHEEDTSSSTTCKCM